MPCEKTARDKKNTGEKIKVGPQVGCRVLEISTELVEAEKLSFLLTNKPLKGPVKISS